MAVGDPEMEMKPPGEQHVTIDAQLVVVPADVAREWRRLMQGLTELRSDLEEIRTTTRITEAIVHLMTCEGAVRELNTMALTKALGGK